MGNYSNDGSWTKELGGIWFLCLFAGFMMGGVGLFITIPIAIVCTIKALWEDNKEKLGLPGGSSQYHSYGGSSQYKSYGGGIQNLNTMDIPHSSYSAAERRAEYIRRGQSPSGVIDGVYNDTYLPSGVSYNDTNRDWDADA